MFPCMHLDVYLKKKFPFTRKLDNICIYKVDYFAVSYNCNA